MIRLTRNLTLIFAFFLVKTGVSMAMGINTFAGTIGKTPIYLTISTEDDYLSGSYFYKSTLLDIPFSGKHSGNNYVLKSEQIPYQTEEEEVFELTENDGVLTGWWKKGTKKLAVELRKPANSDINNNRCTKNPRIKEESYSDYLKIKIGLFKLESLDSASYTDGKKLYHFRETHTGIEFFRIDSGLVAPLLTQANYYLEYYHIDQFMQCLSCYVAGGSTEYYFDYSIEAINETWMNFSVNAYYYCGGPHPDNYQYGVNYSFRASEPIYFKDIVKEQYQNPENDNSDPVGKKVVEYLKKESPDLFSEDYEMNCEYDQPEWWGVSNPVVFTDYGIYIMPSFPHHMLNCKSGEWPAIPYEELEEFIEPVFYKQLRSIK